MKWATLLTLFLMAACSSPLGLLGGGPKISANVQAGKENTQQIVANQTSAVASRDIVTKTASVEAKQIDNVNIQQTPVWIIILLILGWLLPSPNEISRWIRGLFRK